LCLTPVEERKEERALDQMLSEPSISLFRAVGVIELIALRWNKRAEIV